MQDSSTYSKPFSESTQWIAEKVLESLSETIPNFDWLDQVEDCIYIKNYKSKLLFSNIAYNRVFSNGQSNVGLLTSTYLDNSILEVSKQTDALIFGGSRNVECEHAGLGAEGKMYAMQTYKANLQPAHRSEFAILGITRPIHVIDDISAKLVLDLRVFLDKYQTLSNRDQEICRLVSLGHTCKEIGDQHGLTTRAIELRKQKIFAELGISKSIELAKNLVRLEERGFLDIGL